MSASRQETFEHGPALNSAAITATMSISLGECASSPAGAAVAAALQFFAASQCLLQETHPRQTNVTNGSRFDFIIVGGGTAGSALAARLAEVHQFEVLLVEAGGEPPEESIIPGFRDALIGSSYDWNFTTVDDGYSSQALWGHRAVQPRGKMLGGSGSINDMVYARGHPVDYHEWATIAGDTWNWDNVLPYFMNTEHMTDQKIINNSELMKFHGCGGEIEVSGAYIEDYSTAKFLEAFEELGFNVVNDMTYPYTIGAGRFSHTIRDGRRDSSLTALLNKVHSNNLQVLKDTLVTKVLIENNTAVGIKALSNGEELYFYADKEVIVSAGTFNTPKLLFLSGIGPKEYLDDIGIDVVQDLPVGDNLHDHVMVIYYLAAENGTCTQTESTEFFDIIKYLYDASGSLSYSDSMGIYLPQKDADNPTVPYFAIYPSCVPQSRLSYKDCMVRTMYTNDTCVKLASESEQYELITLAIVLLKPQSRGNVRLFSTDPLHDPLIYSGTFSNVVDSEGYPETVKIALSLANTTYFKEKGAHVIDLPSDNCLGLNDYELISCQVREYAMSAWHAVGTAAMGTVVDAELNVLGVGGLRVVDASVMPVVVRGNTNAPVVMIAEKAADFIKKTHGIK